MSGFARARDRLHATISARLMDGTADYLSAGGALLTSGVEVMLDRDVERLDTVSGMLDRAATITVHKAELQPFDRRGALRLDGKTWHIDGIAADDGYWLSLYVVP